MKIETPIKLPSITPAAPVQPRAGIERTNAAGGGDPVHFSAAAAQLQADAQPPMDQARVEEIKQAIAEGRFKVNASAIADRLIVSAKELIDAQRQA